MSYKMKCYPGGEERILVTKEFVERNKLKIDVDAAAGIMDDKESAFGFCREVAESYLPWDSVKKYFNEEYLKKIESGEEQRSARVTDVMEAAQDFLDYMVFAWMKADNERGLSASRSIEKLSAWMKILSRPDVAAVLDDEELYPMYGKPALRKACEMLGIKCPDYL